jgi:hypothetical protein
METEAREIWEVGLKTNVPENLYFFCFYQVQIKKEKLYHHVIIKAQSEDELVKNLLTKDYQYFLRSVSPMQLSVAALKNTVIKHLIWDGESLVARMKEKSFNPNHIHKPSKTNESN